MHFYTIQVCIYIYVHVSILDRHSPEPIAALASRGPGFQGIINKQPWLPGNDKVHFITLPQFQGDQKIPHRKGHSSNAGVKTSVAKLGNGGCGCYASPLNHFSPLTGFFMF